MNGSSNQHSLTIAVDAAGGDFAPEEIVRGAIQAANELGISIIFTGNAELVEKEVNKYDISNLRISIADAPDVIRDGEEPAYAVLKRPNNSVAIAARLVKEGRADAMVSAGNTGASMVSALQYLGTLPGIERPVACGAFLGLAPNTIVLDLGANVGIKPFQLVNFAVAGSVYAKVFNNIENPAIGLLNIGAEEGKGNDQTKEAYKLLKRSGLNFVGNLEGMDIVFGKADVIVCDGFVGNILVKYSEGLGYALSRWLTKELKGITPMEAVEKMSQRLYRLLSPAVALGGGPLVGVDGVVSVAHGNSKSTQIVSTIRNTIMAIESGFVAKLKAELERVQLVVE